MPTERETKLIIIIGYNGTGKTTLSKKIVMEALKHNQRVLIVTPDDIEWRTIPLVHHRHKHHIQTYTGARRIIYEDEETLKSIINYFDNGLLLFDDCRSYLTSNTNADLHKLLIRRRQKMIDIVAVGHGFTEIPPKFFTFASDIALFSTKDNIKRRKDVLKDFDRMAYEQNAVNQLALKNPHAYKIIKQ